MGRKTAALAVLILIAVGCGRQQESGTVDASYDAHALADAAVHTAAARTGKVHLTETSGNRDEGTVTGDGVYDLDAGLSMITTTMPTPTHPDEPSFPEGTLPGTNGASEQMIIQGTTSYVRMAGGSFPGATADQWVKFDDGMGMGMTMGGSGFNPLTNPSAVLEFLQGVGADVTTVGHESIDGVDTTHVHSSFTMDQFLAAHGGATTSTDPAATTPDWGDAAQVRIQIDIYVDGDHYVHRIVSTEPNDVETTGTDPVAGGPADGGVNTTTFDYSDLGQPVSIPVPAPEDVLSMCDLMRHQQAYIAPTVSIEVALPPGC